MKNKLIDLHNSGKTETPWSWVLIFIILSWFGLLIWQSSIHFPIDFKAIGTLFSLSRFGPIQPDLFFSHWLNTLKNYCLLFGFGIGALGTGWSILEKFFPSNRPRLEKVVLSFALGFGFISLATFFLGIARGYHLPIYMFLYIVFASWGGWNVWKRRSQLQPTKGWWQGKSLLLEDRILGMMFWLVIGAALIASNVPEIFFDALTDHLAIPAQWIAHSGIKFLPSVFFSNFPMNIEMLYTGCLMVADERLCRLLNVSLAIFSSLTIFAIGRRWFGRRVGFWAQGIFLTIPLIFFNSTISGVDIGAGFFAVTALLVLLNIMFFEDVPASEVWLVGLLTGIALGSKYTAAFILFPAWMIFFIVRLIQGKSFKSILQIGIKMSLGALLVLAPWLIKNIIMTGNPIYPFLYKIIPTRSIDVEKIQWLMNFGWKEFTVSSWTQLFRLPWDVTFSIPNMGSIIGALFLFFLPGYIWLGFATERKLKMQNVLLAIVFSTLLIWSAKTRMARFLISGIPLLTLLSALVLKKIDIRNTNFGRFVRICVLIFIGWGLLYTAGYSFFLWDPIGASLGLQKKEVYLKQHLLTNYYPMAQVINQLPDQSKIYAFGETRTYYIEKNITAPTAHDTNLLIRWLEQSKTTEDVWNNFRKAGYTHLYVHAQEAVRTRGFEQYQWTPEAIAKWQEFIACYTKRIALIEQQALYSILPQKNMQRIVKFERPLFTYSKEIVDDVNPRADIALRLTNQGDWKKAEAEWKRIIELASGWSPPYIVLASMYQMQKRNADALEKYEQADRLTDLNPEAYHDMGVLYWDMGKQLEAINALKQALKINPQFEIARKHLESMEMIYKERK